VWLAYLGREKLPWKRILRTAGKCYVAFVVSGFAYRFLVDGEASLRGLFRIILLRDIPGYSEFLMSFSLVILLSAVALPFIRRFTRSLGNLLPPGAHYDPVIGLFIGGTGFAYFPVLHYLPFFLLGVFWARRGFRFKFTLFIYSAVCAVVFFLLLALNIGIRRFPPSVLWVSLSAAMYIYYSISLLIDDFGPAFIRRYLNIVGQNVLFYLVLSNIMIFSIKANLRSGLEALPTLFTFAAVMAVVFFLQYISTDLKRVENSLPR